MTGFYLPSRSTPVLTLKTAATFGLTELVSPAGLVVQVTAGGAVFALRHGPVMINQLIPGPAEDALSRLILRWDGPSGSAGWASLVGTTVSHRQSSPSSMEWKSEPTAGILCRVVLSLHPELTAWSWHVILKNAGTSRIKCDVVIAQDLGLNDESTIRINEAFTSQYIDLLPVKDDHLGWTILARQNQTTSEGRHPWLALACESGAVGYCTDGSQFYGGDHRFVGIPAAVRSENLPSRRLQYEGAMAGLQSRAFVLYPAGSAEIVFAARFLADHPAASTAADLGRLWEMMPASAPLDPDSGAEGGHPWLLPTPSLFVSTPWIHGDKPEEKQWTEWFPGERRHEERSPQGELLSFFTGHETHVVARDKEANVARPHGHIIRSGSWRWVDNEQFGATCYAAGIFAAQAYLGNPTFGRLLPVVRDALGVGRASGQRVFLMRGGHWHQLGIPSAFTMTPSEVRWIYQLGCEVIEARVWCSPALPAAFLELITLPAGSSSEFLITHTLSLGPNEFEHSGTVQIHHEEGWVTCVPDAESALGLSVPGSCFGIACSDAESGAEIGGDEMLYSDGRSRLHPCISIRTGKVNRFGIILCGTPAGQTSLESVVRDARQEWTAGGERSGPPPAPVRLAIDSGQAHAVSRLDEMLPWLTHNAAIHFSAPHGLEQQAGAAWGVRDVCQGSVEWLLAACDWPLIRRILETVFAQQYSRDGSWPQWFMHPPFRAIQQAHCHGDVCFWPVKALCDYVEACNDLGLLHMKVGYTDPVTFMSAGPEESLLRHCDRVIDQCEARFVQGTALVNYGDGDWDDTLQPADPAMRTRMISAWTVGLVYHTLRQLAEVYRRAGEIERCSRLEALLTRMKGDFSQHLMPGGIVAGFVVTERNGKTRPLLHPFDEVTGIRYRLLPMTRAILGELFNADQAKTHLDIIHRELVYPDGARLMSEPALYRGGCEHLFKRADTAANVGREIGLQYVHAHLRYAEAMAKVGDAERLWTALQVVNPVGLREVLDTAVPRQSNVYFSSSDAEFPDRVEAARRWSDLRTGSVSVRGGWRLYSSGPGLFLHVIRASLLGLRESFGDVTFDPVLPLSLDGLVARVRLCGRAVEVRFSVENASFGPRGVSVNGVTIPGPRREANPYRTGGLCYPETVVGALLREGPNVMVVQI